MKTMGFYRAHVLPRAIHFACSLKPAMQQREKVVPLASGRVLEIGIGSGLNLPYYAPGKVEHLWGLDPSRETWRLAAHRPRTLDFDCDFLEASAESIPLDDGCIDSVLMTYTLCSIADVSTALAEVRRVLRPGGRLIFCEHGTAPDLSVRRWQNRLNPLWRRISGGCNLNREPPALLRQGGFEIRELEACYLPGWRPVSFNYLGVARPLAVPLAT